MKNNNMNTEAGIGHPLMIGLTVLVITVVGFSAYRIGQRSSDDLEQARTDESSQTQLVDEIKVTEEKTTEISVPEEKKEEVEATQPVKTEETVKKQEPVVDTNKKNDDEKTYLTMGKAAGSQSGSVVKAAADMPKPLSGKCNFKLYHDNHDNIYSSNQVTSASKCSGQLNIANLPTYDGWSVHVWFDGADGKTFAYGESTPIALANPN